MSDYEIAVLAQSDVNEIAEAQALVYEALRTEPDSRPDARTRSGTRSAAQDTQ